MAQYKGPASESQRVMQLQKKRERHLDDIEIKKKKLADDLKVGKMESKFSAHYDEVENDLKSSTVGLLTMDEMKSRQDKAVKDREMLLARKDREELLVLRREEKEREKQRKRQSQQIKALSFNPDEEEVGDEPEIKQDPDVEETKPEASTMEDLLKRKRFGKNPDVDTSFLPDVDRDEEENKLREQLRQEWEQRQAKLKAEEIEITFSYWDGSGHRRNLMVKKGNSIYQFLQKALEDLRPDFPELRAVTADQLMYVKEDLILPQTNTFYDFIVTKARGKSGPLFSFDVREDIRMVHDATVEKEESHAGKVVIRSWYERNKHIFPASRWEPYDPTKTYEKYTYHDKKTPKAV
jgi:protein FAM50